MTCQRRGFLSDPFHKVAIAADGVRVMVDDVMPRAVIARSQPRLRYRHSHAISETLSEWSGRNFHARCPTALRVPRGLAVPLAEVLDLVHGKVVAGQMQETVQEHRTVTRGQHKTVPVKPLGIGGIELEKFGPQSVGH